MIRIIIADDESLAREELTRRIESVGEFKVTAQASTGSEALRLIESEKPDAVFLDIEMPGMTGLEVAVQLSCQDKPPLVVFATAYHQYAIEAFEANAIAYILKPYDPEKLEKALERVKGLLQAQTSQAENLRSLGQDLMRKGALKKIIGHKHNSKDKVLLDPKDILFFHAEYAQVIACIEEDAFIVNLTLKELLQQLDPEKFAQTHKAYIVNMDKIEKVSPMFSGNYQINLLQSKRASIPLSRRYAKPIKDRLGGW